MAVPADTLQAVNVVGTREELADRIYDISPTETPFFSRLKVGKKPKNTKVEWQTDALATPNADNKNIQGDDAANDALSPTTRLANYTQLMDKVVQVSSTAMAVTNAGRREELGYQIAKQSKEIKRDAETRICGNFASVAPAAGVPSETAGYLAWLTSNTDRGGAGTDGGFQSGTGLVDAATNATTQRAFEESQLQDVIQSCWDNGGEPDTVIVGSFNKRVASGFAGIATQYRDNPQTGPGTIIASADIYVSDFGQFKIVPSRFSSPRDAMVIDYDHWSLCYLQPFKLEKLAKTGHSERRMLAAELALMCGNEASSGAVADLTTSV